MPSFSLPERRLKRQGFTLVELLVAVALSSLTVVVAVQILGPQLRMNQRMEGYSKLQERWARFSYLLDTEIPKARFVNTSANILTLTVLVPNLNIDTSICGNTAPSLASNASIERTIVYKLDPLQPQILLRIGPPIDCWGRLSANEAASQQTVLEGVVTNAGAGENNLFFSSMDSTNSTINYKLNLKDSSSGAVFLGRGSTARGRADCLSFEEDTDQSCLNLK